MDLSKVSLSYSDSFLNFYKSLPEEFLKIEGIDPGHLDIANMTRLYFTKRSIDMSIDDNANANDDRAYGSYLSESAKGFWKLQGFYELYKVMEEEFGMERACELLRSSIIGDLYIHDSTSITVPYCWAYSTLSLLFNGSNWGHLHSLPPVRRRSFVDQVKEVTIEIAQQIAGAVAIGDFFVNYAYFVKKENLDLSMKEVEKDIENDFQSLVHTLNKKLRSSYQSPFSNLSIFDKPNLEKLFGELRYPDGSSPDFDLILKLQKIFCNWFSKGDPNTGLPYRFPVVTLNIRIDENRKIIDKESFKYFSEINLDKGCFNIYVSSGNKVASCCRLINDIELVGVDSFGNGGISLGSHRVVTLNLARYGGITKDPDLLIDLLDNKLTEAKDILLAHRKLLYSKIKDNFLPFFDRGIMSMERMFSTFGINGIYECLQELGHDVFSKEGKELTHRILKKINEFATNATKETGYPFNVEQVPAESLAVKFALKDKLLYGMDYPLYSNQFIPLWVDCDIVDRVKLDGEFSKSLTGGGISHLNVGEKLTSPLQMERLIEYAIDSGCEHFAINYNFCRCKNGHVTVSGVATECYICGAEIEDYLTRIIGYFTPVSAWAKGRQQEHKIRVFKKDLLSHAGTEFGNFTTANLEK